MRQFSYPNSQFTNILGGASIGWKLNVYDTGTTDYASIYSNLAQTTPTANPVIADADGFLASFYWTGTVDVVLTDENNNLIDSAAGIQDLVSTISAVVVAGNITLPFGDASGDGNTITATLPITADFSDGGVFVVRANANNAGTINTPNLQINSYASRRIKKIGGSALVANDIVSGMNMVLVYNESQDCYYLINHEATFLKRDGTAAMLAALNMGSQKITSLAAGTAAGDAVRLDQVQTHYGTATGTCDAMIVSIPSVLSYVDGMTVTVLTTSGFSTVASPTININGLGVKSVIDASLTYSIYYADISGLVTLVYSAYVDRFILTTPQNGGTIGVAKTWAGTSTPVNHLVADGYAVSRTTYAKLFGIIGTTWGTGDGSTTFNLPDGRAKGFLGADLGKGDDAALMLGETIAQQGGLAEIDTLTGGSPTFPPTTVSVPQDGSFTSIFTTGDAVSGTDQSMKVKNYPFVYPRSFVGTWIIKYQ
jgi:microcystin-dependent protein